MLSRCLNDMSKVSTKEIVDDDCGVEELLCYLDESWTPEDLANIAKAEKEKIKSIKKEN